MHPLGAERPWAWPSGAVRLASSQVLTLTLGSPVGCTQSRTLTLTRTRTCSHINNLTPFSPLLTLCHTGLLTLPNPTHIVNDVTDVARVKLDGPL